VPEGEHALGAESILERDVLLVDGDDRAATFPASQQPAE